jgi:hypothetical protein
MEGMSRILQAILSSSHGVCVIADELRELDDQRVLVLGHRTGRAKASGLQLADLRTEGAWLFHVRDGHVFRLINYWDRDRALADLGLKT